MLLNLFVYLKTIKQKEKNLENLIVYLTFGIHGNSFIIRTDPGSILDASLANDVVDSAELSNGVDVSDIIVAVSSSTGVLLPFVDPSSLAISESKANCFVKIYVRKYPKSNLVILINLFSLLVV